MPNEMNHTMVADNLDDLSKELTSQSATWKQMTVIQAAANERRIANGKLSEVVHGEWICEDHLRQCSNCRIFMGMDRMEIPERFKYCPFCGALMGEARKGDSLSGKDDRYEK